MWHTVRAIMGLSDPLVADIAKGIVNYCFGMVGVALLGVSVFIFDSWLMSVSSFCFSLCCCVAFSAIVKED